MGRRCQAMVRPPSSSSTAVARARASTADSIATSTATALATAGRARSVFLVRRPASLWSRARKRAAATRLVRAAGRATTASPSTSK